MVRDWVEARLQSMLDRIKDRITFKILSLQNPFTGNMIDRCWVS